MSESHGACGEVVAYLAEVSNIKRSWPRISSEPNYHLGTFGIQNKFLLLEMIFLRMLFFEINFLDIIFSSV